MPLRNVPITYTLDQQRQEINALAADVNGLDVTFDEKVDDRVAALLQGGVGTAVTYDDANGSLTIDLAFNEFSTSSVLEGTNLYFTDARANAAIDARVNQTFVNNLNITNLGPQDSITLSLGQTTKYLTPLNYNNVSWDTAYGWGDHGAVGYLTSYTETSTLNDVVGRGDTTASSINVGGVNTNSITTVTASENLTLTGNNVVVPSNTRFGTIANALANDYGVLVDKDGEIVINHAPGSGGLTLKSSGNTTFNIDGTGKINGVVKFVTSDGNAGQSLTTDGNGQLYWGEGGGANVEVGDNPPSNATSGDMWWESDSGRLKVYYDNGANPAAWVDASPPLVADSPNSAFRTAVGDVDASFTLGGSGTLFADDNGTFNAGITVSNFSRARISILFGKLNGTNNTSGLIAIERSDGSSLTEICTIATTDPNVTGVTPLYFEFIDNHGGTAGDIMTYQIRLKSLTASGSRTGTETCQLYVQEI